MRSIWRHCFPTFQGLKLRMTSRLERKKNYSVIGAGPKSLQPYSFNPA
jgi:hypothetical protein